MVYLFVATVLGTEQVPAADPGFLEGGGGGGGGGSNNYIHKRGWVLEGACPLP